MTECTKCSIRSTPKYCRMICCCCWPFFVEIDHTNNNDELQWSESLSVLAIVNDALTTNIKLENVVKMCALRLLMMTNCLMKLMIVMVVAFGDDGDDDDDDDRWWVLCLLALDCPLHNISYRCCTFIFLVLFAFTVDRRLCRLPMTNVCCFSRHNEWANEPNRPTDQIDWWLRAYEQWDDNGQTCLRAASRS